MLATAIFYEDGIDHAGFLDSSVLGSDHKGMYANLSTQALMELGETTYKNHNSVSYNSTTRGSQMRIGKYSINNSFITKCTIVSNV
jgi:hypothetical protein